MLTIKDFKAGDPAYIVVLNTGTTKDAIIYPTEVLSVGRKYLTVTYNKRYQNFDCEYLQEVADFGESNLLFKTEKDAEDYLEKSKLALWLGLISVRRAEKYTLEQLRRVKDILIT